MNGKLKPMLNTYRLLMSGIYALQHGEIEVDINKLKSQNQYASIDIDWLIEKRKKGETKLTDDQIHKARHQIEALFVTMDKMKDRTALPEAPTDEQLEWVDEQLVRLRKRRMMDE